MKTSKTKYKAIVLVLLLSFIFTSCSNNDNADNQAPNFFNLVQFDYYGVDLQPQLNWEIATDLDGDQVTYEVFLDTQNPPLTSIANNLEVNTFTVLENLLPETNYFWMVTASDTFGNTTKSNLDSFTTKNIVPVNPLVGKWFFDNIFGDPFTDCGKTSFLLFTNELNIQIIENQDYTGVCEEIRQENGTYELIENNQIEVTINSETEIWEIQSITETELVLYMDGGLYTYLKE